MGGCRLRSAARGPTLSAMGGFHFGYTLVLLFLIGVPVAIAIGVVIVVSALTRRPEKGSGQPDGQRR